MKKANTRIIKRQESTDKIIKSATLVFAEKGYSSATLNEIALDAGFSQGLVSQRFDKEQLLLEVLKSQISNILEKAKDYDLNQLLTMVIDVIKTYDPVFKTFQDFWTMFLTSRDIPSSVLDYFKQTLIDSGAVDLFKKGMDEGFLKKGDSYEQLILFLKSTVELVAVYKRANLILPDDSEFLEIVVEKKHLENKQLQEKDKFGIISSLNSDYDLIASISVSKRKATIYYVSDWAQSIIRGYDYDVVTEKEYIAAITSLIIPEDLPTFIENNHMNVIFAGLAKSRFFDMNFRIKKNDKIEYYQMKFTLDVSNKDNLIVAIKSIEDEVKLQVQQAKLEKEISMNRELEKTYNKLREMTNFNKFFMDKYISLHYIDLTNNRQVVMKRSSDLHKDYDSFNDDYYYSVLRYIDREVFEDDKARFREIMSPHYLKTKLHQDEELTYTYRNVKNGNKYYMIQIIKGRDNDYVAVGIQDVDNGVRNRLKQEEIIKTKEMQEADMFKVLADKYLAIYHLNLITGEFRSFLIQDRIQKDTLQLFKKYKDFESIITEFIKQSVHDDDKVGAIKFLKSAKKSLATEREIEHKFRRKIEGEWRYYKIEIVKLDEIDDPLTAAIITFSDVTEQNEAELERQQILSDAKKLAEEASKAKSTFLFNMSHDIRTPMNAIIGFTQKAERNIDNPKIVKDCLTKVQASNAYLLQLINDVLDMARIESGKVSIEEFACNCQQRAIEYADIVKGDAENRGLTFHYDFSDIQTPIVYQDGLRVRQVVANLVSNALKYTKPGGTVSYEMHQIPSKKEGYASFLYIIQDNGIGMSKEYLEHVFDEFTREKSSTVSGIQGTGLGMSIVKKLIDMMGGRIEVESKLGEGTTIRFWLDFRLATENDINQNDTKTLIEEASLDGTKILLVEDNELNREIATDILTEAGATIDSAEDGSVAVEKLKNATKDTYDVVLMDIQMPYMNGYEATKIIRKFDNPDIANIPIIAMTANAFDEDRKKALSCGMNDHIAKPIDIKILISTIKKIKKV